MPMVKREELIYEESQVVDIAAGGYELWTQGGATVATDQKRFRDDHGAPASRKAYIVDIEETVQVKILILSAAVGAVTGKGRKTMRNLTSESGYRLQMSKNREVCRGDFFTNVKGKIASVMKVMEVVVEKIKEKVDPNTHSDVYDHRGVDRTKEMKQLVPSTSAGMVIGKSGAHVKEIRDQTGASTDAAHAHRASQTSNTQPLDFTNRHGGGAPFGSMQQTQLAQVGATQVWQPAQQRLLEATYCPPKRSFYSKGSGGTFKFNPMQGLGNQEFTLRTSDFNEASVADVMQAMHMLAKHNVMGLGLSLGVPAMAQMRSNEPSNVQHPQSLIQAPRYDSASAMDPDSLMDSADRHYAAHSDINKNKADGGAGYAGPNFASTFIKEKLVDSGHVELEVPDAVVGAVLSPKADTGRNTAPKRLQGRSA